jgi:hypothetical protein
MLAWSMWARAEEMGNVDAVLEKMQVTKLEDADGWDVTASAFLLAWERVLTGMHRRGGSASWRGRTRATDCR